MSGAGLDYEGDIRRRVKLLEPERIAQVAAQAGVPLAADDVAKFLHGLVHGYVDSRIGYEVRAVPPPLIIEPNSDEWAKHREGGDGWDGNEHYDLLKREVGGPPNEPLIYVYDALAVWWNDLIPPEGQKRRKVWRPVYVLDGSQTLPVEQTAMVFLYVAKSLDPLYTGTNCNSVASFVKVRGMSPDAKRRRAEKRKAWQALPEVKAKRLAAQRARRGNKPPSH